MPNVLTMGTMDTMHPGHLGLIRKCRALAGKKGKVFVAVNTDDFVESYKGVTPIFNVNERVAMAEAVRGVWGTVYNDGSDQPAIIDRCLSRGDLLVIGDDWAGRDYLAQIGLGDNRNWLEERGITLVYVPRTGDWSTSEIRSRIKS